MNLLLLEDTDFSSESIAWVDGRRKKHLMSVNQVKPGDRLKCGRINGLKGTATVLDINSTRISFEVCLDETPPEALPLTLVLALPRPKMLRRIIQHITAMGVKKIHLTNSWRVERSFWKSPVMNEAVFKEQMILGLEQSGDTMLPKIHLHRFFKSFADSELGTMVGQSDHAICAHPVAQTACPSGITGRTVLAVGPEGGWVEKEVNSFQEHGMGIHHLGPRILKVETAVTALIARLYV